MEQRHRTHESKLRQLLRNFMHIGTVLLLGLVAYPGSGHAAQSCGPNGGFTYSFAQGVPLTALVVKALRPRKPGQSIFRGAGTISIAGSTDIPLKVTGHQAKAGQVAITYAFSGRVPGTSVQGTLTFAGCPTTLTKVRIGLARRHQKRVTIQDPLLFVTGAHLRPAVLMLDRTDIGGLSVDIDDPTLLHIPATDPLAAELVPGAILVVGITPATPKGLLRRVVSVVPGSPTTIITEPAALVDAFTTMHLQISDASLTSSAQQLLFARPLDVGCTRPLCIGAAISLDLDDGHGATASFAGNLFADAGVDIDLDVDFDDIDVSGHVDVAGDIGGSFGITATESLDFGDKKEKKFEEIEFPPIEVAGIEVTPKVKLFGGASGGLTGTLDTGVDGKVFAKAGLVCQHIDDCAFDLDHGLSFDSHLTIEAGAAAKLWIRPQIDLAVYDSASLFGSLTPFVEFNANTSATPWWTLQGGVDGDIGLDVDAWFRTFTPFEKEFTVFEFHIADAPDPYGCESPCIPPTILTTGLEDATDELFYDVTLAGDGEAPLQWSLGSGALPAGLSLEPSGEIDGTPIEVGTFDFGVVLTDRFGRTTTASLSLTVDAPEPTPTPTSTPGVPPGCGDGQLDADEQCDRGSDNGTARSCCSLACAVRTGTCFIDGYGPGNCNGTSADCIFTIF